MKIPLLAAFSITSVANWSVTIDTSPIKKLTDAYDSGWKKFETKISSQNVVTSGY